MTVAGWFARQSWRCWSPLVSGQLMERVMLVMVLLMPMAKGRCRPCTE